MVRQIVDDCTDHDWSIFVKNMIEIAIFNSISDLYISGIDIKFILCDDTGKIILYKSCLENEHNINFGFQVQELPQKIES
jgi:hypothetical protein